MHLFKKPISADNNGFTLIEVLVVIAIIGVLAAVVFASFDSARKQSRDKVRKSDLKQLQLAVELYKAQNGQYPAKGCGVTSSSWVGPGSFTASPWGTECADYIAGLAPGYIPTLPNDPNQEADDGRGFIYQVNGSRTAYKILVHGSVESTTVDSYADEFARCPRDYNVSYCDGVPQTDVYAVYSAGAEDW